MELIEKNISSEELIKLMEFRKICETHFYEPEDGKCVNCLYCRECIYEYEDGYECLSKHFWFYPEDGIPNKPCLKSNDA